MLYFIRTFFVGLLIFELLNWVGILGFKLSFSWFGLIVTSLVVWGMVEFLWRKLAEMRAREKGWLLFFILLAVLVDLFGDIFRWYDVFVWYDQFAHFVGGFAASVAAVIVLRAANILPDFSVQPHLSFAMQLFLVVSIVALLGIAYELEEYAETIFLGNNRLGDRFDTPNDLMFNTLGSIIGGFITLKNVHQPFWRMVKKLLKFRK